MNILQRIALALVIVGALNWGLIGLFDFNLVAFLFDGISVIISKIVYVLVGVGGLVSIITLFMPNVDEHYHTVNHA